MKKGTKIALGLGFALIVGVIIYFIVKEVRKPEEEQEKAQSVNDLTEEEKRKLVQRITETDAVMRRIRQQIAKNRITT